MGVDRESAIKKAEDLVREGKPDLAIEEYLRLVDEQPGDVGAANALGDLYAKIGNRAAAVAQFVQIGDTHRESGFVPKAIAFYKKALKVDPASDQALSQLAQIAVEQELFVDATLYLNRLLQRRREQKNEAGVAECLVRLGAFPTATADAKTAAARAATGLFVSSEVARLWIDAADALERAGRPRDAVDGLMQALGLDTEDVALRRRVVLACADTGQIERAQAWLSFETAGDRGDLLMALARQALAEGRDDDARRALHRVIEVAPDERAEAEALLSPMLSREPEAEAEEIAIDVFDGPAAGSASRDDWGAIGPAVEPAPVSDVETFGDVDDAAALDAAVEPALVEPVSPEEAVTSPELEWSELFGDDDAGADAGLSMPEPSEPVAETEAAFVVDEMSGIDADTGPEPVIELEPEAVFQQVTGPVVDAPEVEPVAAAAAPEPAPASVATFDVSPADASTIAALTAAAENPALLFQASAQLGRLLLRLDRGREGVAWLERATQSTTAVREQRLDVMYELGDALERIGERVRALDVFADLDFDAASYRDVPERMARLRRALEEGRAP